MYAGHFCPPLAFHIPQAPLSDSHQHYTASFNANSSWLRKKNLSLWMIGGQGSDNAQKK
tara:strand:+ start:453 stop:629 length:177 start_codon:yes stop_codon:yes gene_type:complete